MGVDLEIDVIGLKCPLPVLKLKKRIEPLKPGDTVRMMASDPTTLKDVPSYCQLAGHRLLKAETQDEVFVFWIRIAD